LGPLIILIGAAKAHAVIQIEKAGDGSAASSGASGKVRNENLGTGDRPDQDPEKKNKPSRLFRAKMRQTNSLTTGNPYESGAGVKKKPDAAIKNR